MTHPKVRIAGSDLYQLIVRAISLAIFFGSFSAVILLCIGVNAWADGSPFAPPLWLLIYAAGSVVLFILSVWGTSINDRAKQQVRNGGQQE